MRKLLMWVLVFLGLGVMAQEVRVTVEITNTAKLGPVYEIEFLSFTKDGMPIGEFPIVPPVPIPPGETKQFGPYSLKEAPNDLVIKGTKRTLVSVGPFTVKFSDLQHCQPVSHPDEALRVHLFIYGVTPVPFPPTIPIPPAPVIPGPGRQAIEEGWSKIRAGIEEAMRAFAPILGETRLNMAATAFWASGERMLVVVPADPIVLKPEAVIGLIAIRGFVDFRDLEFYAMRLGRLPPSPPEPWPLELLSSEGRVIKVLRAKLPPEMAYKAISGPNVHIITYEEPAGPGGILLIKICIGWHRANCDCIGIYIEI